MGRNWLSLSTSLGSDMGSSKDILPQRLEGMTEIDLSMSKELKFLLEPARYKICHGGRGSGKSWGFARALILLALTRKVRILCAREIQKSIRDSVHRLLGDQIESLGLSGHFIILRDEIKCIPTGSQFLFSGLANTTIESIKSFEGCHVCWIEEAQTISERSLEILIPTIRAPGSEIWMTFNPSETTDPVYQRFVLKQPPDTKVVRMNWDHNPWFPEELEKEKNYLYSVDPEAAAHVWGGECRKMSDAQVLRGRYVVESFTPRECWDGPYHGVDFGFATDPSVMVKVWIFERKLYVESEAWGIGVEIDHLPACFDSIVASRKYISRADSSRPETISFLVRAGFNMVPVKKWPGSVEDGVEYLRSFEQVVIHPDCKHTAEEARLYSYQTDAQTGDVKPKLLDRHNHCLERGTMVATSHGTVPIERVNIGDHVLTRDGFKPVRNAWMSGKDKPVFKLATARGLILYGTGDHEVFTQRGLVRMDALRYTDSVMEAVCLNESVTMGSHTDDTQRHQSGRSESTTAPQNYQASNAFTGRSGLTTMATSLMDAIFTTSMGILSTMIPRTWRVSPEFSTSPNTTKASVANQSGSISTPSGISPSNGISQKMGESGTWNTRSKWHLWRSIKRLLANAAARNTEARPLEGSVRRLARQSFVEIPGLMTKNEYVKFVESLSNAPGSLMFALVEDRVERVSESHVASEVYDLTVEGKHEFFANGILVSNCMDAIRYAISPIIEGHLKQIPEREEPEEFYGNGGNGSWMR